MRAYECRREADCPGDLDGDVDLSDLAALLVVYGPTCEQEAAAFLTASRAAPTVNWPRSSAKMKTLFSRSARGPWARSARGTAGAAAPSPIS